MTGILVPAVHDRQEIWEKNSHFISQIAPAFNVDQARSFIENIKHEYSDATHNVPVFVIGAGTRTIEHASDDGEPSGTAGKPALAVLKGSGLGDAVMVITRYFGGTKLGTGGLVRAYTRAAQVAVDRVPKAMKISVHRIDLELPYPYYDQIRRLIRNHHGSEISEEFTDLVRLSCNIPVSRFEKFNSEILELTSGSVSGEITQRNLDYLQPRQPEK